MVERLSQVKSKEQMMQPRSVAWLPDWKRIVRQTKTQLTKHTKRKLIAIEEESRQVQHELSREKDREWIAIMETRLRLCEDEASILRMQKELFEFVMDIGTLLTSMIADTDTGIISLAEMSSKLFQVRPTKEKTQALARREFVKILRERLNRQRQENTRMMSQTASETAPYIG